MKLFGKIVLAAVAVTSVIAFSSCSQETTPVAAYQYKESAANATNPGAEKTLVFYGDEKKGSFAISTAELKFNGKNGHNRLDTTIYFLDADGNRSDAEGRKLENQFTELTVPSYVIMKGKYTIGSDDSGNKSLALSDVEILKKLDNATVTADDLEGAYDAWETLLTATTPLEWDTSKNSDQLENDAKKNGYITKDTDGKFVIKKTVVVSEYGEYAADSSITSGTIDSNGVIEINGTTFDEVL